MQARLSRGIVAACKIALAAALLVYLGRSGKISFEGIRSMLGGGHFLEVGLAAILFLTAQALGAARLRVLLHASGIPAGFGLCFRLTMMGFVFNNVVPGTVGGDLVKIHCLLQLPAGAKGRSPGAVLMDRLMGAAAIVLLSGFSMLYLLNRFGDVVRLYAKALQFVGIAAAAFIGALLLLLFCSRNPRIRAFLKEKLRARLPALAYDAAEGLGRVAGDIGALARAFALSILLQLVGLAGLLTLAQAAGTALPPLADMAAVSLIVMLAGVIPLTPGNIGWTEFLAMMGWAAVGSQAGAAVILNWRIVTTVCALPWGVLYLAAGAAADQKVR